MPSFWLEYVQDGQRREFSFDSGSVSVGRDKGSDFVLDHPTVSRQHAIITSNPQGHQLVVLSRGGLTAIDGSQVSGEIDLYDGSQIHFGQLAFTFRSQNAPRKAENNGQQNGGWQSAAQAPSQSGSWDQPSGAQAGLASQSAPRQSGSWDQPQGGLSQQSGSWNQPSGPQAAQQSGSWNQPSGPQSAQQSGSWNQPSGPQSGSWNQPQGNRQSGEFGAPATGNFGQQPQSTGNFGQGGGSGQGALGGNSWDSQIGDEDEWGGGDADPDAGLMSWDQIAASADAESEVEVDAADAALSDFEKIKNAQERAEKQSRGNPLLKYGGIVAIVGFLGFIGYMEWQERQGGAVEPKTVQVDNAPPKIDWKKEDIDCVGEATCKAEALNAYRVGNDICEQLDSSAGNRYVCFFQMSKAEQLLAAGGIEKPPKEMKGYTEIRDKLAKDLQSRFQQLRANVYSDQKLKMWDRVADKLSQIKQRFPDKRCNYHQWALERERKMKEAGTYPAQQTYVPQ